MISAQCKTEDSMKNKIRKEFIITCSLLISILLLTGCSFSSDIIAFHQDTGQNNEEISSTHNNLDPKAGMMNVSKISKQNVKSSVKQFVKKKLIVIDAGHQSKGNNQKEPIGPGAKITKPKVSSGTSGIASGVPEYKLNLSIAKKVQKELIRRGYTVIMIRTTNEVNLSNKERADIANKSGADLFIRIHADSITDSSVTGASTLYPSKNNPYVPGLSAKSYALSKAVISRYCDKTGAKNRGAIARDDMSGINWCKIPVTIIEMGFMSNRKEDLLMQTGDYQNKMSEGICDGIDDYFR